MNPAAPKRDAPAAVLMSKCSRVLPCAVSRGPEAGNPHIYFGTVSYPPEISESQNVYFVAVPRTDTKKVVKAGPYSTGEIPELTGTGNSFLIGPLGVRIVERLRQ